MNVDKIRNLTDVELNHQQRELSDQLFKMKFQLKMGQTESLKKIRELKKFYELDLDSSASHRLKEIKAKFPRRRTDK